MPGQSVKPDQVIALLTSDSLKGKLSVLTERWGKDHLNEHTFAAISHSEVMNGIYFNKELDSDLSRPFLLEFPSQLSNECPHCEKSNVRGDLVLISRTGDVILWVEVKLVTSEDPLRKSRVTNFKCDIFHASCFESGTCIVFFDDVLSLRSRRKELEKYAEDRGVDLRLIGYY